MSALMWSVQDQKGNNALCGLLGAAAVPDPKHRVGCECAACILVMHGLNTVGTELLSCSCRLFLGA